MKEFLVLLSIVYPTGRLVSSIHSSFYEAQFKLGVQALS